MKRELLHELAKDVEALNASVPGESRIVSAVSSPIDTGSEVIRNYKLEIRPPLGQSYAREIAAHYGISYQQLKDSKNEKRPARRGVW